MINSLGSNSGFSNLIITAGGSPSARNRKALPRATQTQLTFSQGDAHRGGSFAMCAVLPASQRGEQEPSCPDSARACLGPCRRTKRTRGSANHVGGMR